MSTVTIDMASHEFQECLRRVFCMSKQDFIDVFGPEDGEYQWEKYKFHFQRDVFEWITYLDLNNMEKLFLHMDQHITKIRRKN